MLYKQKILLIHKNKIIKKKISDYLHEIDFAVMIAENIEDAFNLAKSIEPEIILWGDVLTSDGKKIGKSIYENDLTEEEKQKIEQIKTKYNSIPLYNLLKYVYKKFPEVTTQSVIRDKYPS